MSQTRTVANPMSVSIALVQAMRPHQWIKNLLVFAALLFTAQFLTQRWCGRRCWASLRCA